MSYFNHAFSEVQASAQCCGLLGPAGEMRAYGESSWNKWTRNRAIAATTRQDGSGRDHLLIHFNVEGRKGKGVCRIHLVRPNVESRYEYKTLTLEVPGHQTVFLRNSDPVKDKKKGMNFLGVQWG